MPPIDPVFAAALLVSALLLSLLWARRRSGGIQRKAAELPLDTVADWPPQLVRVLTLPERQALEVLRRALPRHLVLAQVPLSRFISVPPGKSHNEWLNRVGRLSVDLLVCDRSSAVVAAVEIRGDDETTRSAKRHQRMARVLKAARVPLHQWHGAALPSVADVRTLLLPTAVPMETPPASMPGGLYGRDMLPVPEMMEVLAAGDEEFGNLPQHDPVPSGFFDDLDAMAPEVPGRR